MVHQILKGGKMFYYFFCVFIMSCYIFLGTMIEDKQTLLLYIAAVFFTGIFMIFNIDEHEEVHK